MHHETIALEQFLLSGRSLEFTPPPDPLITIIVVLFNKAAFSFACLKSIRDWASDAEVIVVDNHSTDQTALLLARIRGAKIVSNDTNQGFVSPCNLAAKTAAGRHLLFLNNDATLFPDTVRAAIRAFDKGSGIGAVGAKILLPDGTLQEAGSIIWKDGTCRGYGRGDDPFAPQYMFQRAVDYCSGAFLLTPRALFDEMGGFHQAYAPMYYEDTDYCFRLNQKGFRIIYEPGAVILHHEFSSSTSKQNALRIMSDKRSVFFQRHERALAGQWPADERNVLIARTHRRWQPAKRILYVDDAVPLPCSGAGLPRGNEIIKAMVSFGFGLTIYPTVMVEEDWEDVYRHIPASVEIILHGGRKAFKEFLSERIDYYDILFVCRPGNMEMISRLMRKAPKLFKRLHVVYDSEAIYALREMARVQVCSGMNPSRKLRSDLSKALEKEVGFAQGAHRIIAVSEAEKGFFAAKGARNVTLLGHAVDQEPTRSGFRERKGFLFVGAIYGDETPNADALLWFGHHVLPHLNRLLNDKVPVLVAGLNKSQAVLALASEQVKILGRIDDLVPLYDACRVFVAPTRFASGIPHKVTEAAALGIPVVATTLLAEQLTWTDGIELLAADPRDPEAFARLCAALHAREDLWNVIRRNSLHRVRKDHGKGKFLRSLEEVLRF